MMVDGEALRVQGERGEKRVSRDGCVETDVLQNIGISEVVGVFGIGIARKK